MRMVSIAATNRVLTIFFNSTLNGLMIASRLSDRVSTAGRKCEAKNTGLTARGKVRNSVSNV